MTELTVEPERIVLLDELAPGPRRRSFRSELEVLDDDGRTVLGRMFPFGETAHVREIVDGTVLEYDEEFLPNCTLRMRQAAQRRGGSPAWIRFRLDHGEDFDREVGFCSGLEERDDGAYGTFRLWEGDNLAKARSMLAESHTGLSVEFVDVARPRVRGTTVGRVQINVSHCAATPTPVYASAGILELRADGDPTEGTPNLDRVRAMLAELDGVGSLTLQRTTP